jgi:hypothetical protein
MLAQHVVVGHVHDEEVPVITTDLERAARIAIKLSRDCESESG